MLPNYTQTGLDLEFRDAFLLSLIPNRTKISY
jgi:hypothetical protein